jgi:2-polyprenyl-3-methyl-5-hydroxy-6-metoxy-1,4-benzoquinol methylase
MYHLPLDRIPWEIQEPPAELSDVLSRGIIKTGRALDLGCGTGHYALYLAKHGFEVTGVDLSPEALRVARQRATDADLPARFVEGDVRRLAELNLGTFDFILEYSLLHHIAPAELQAYASQLTGLLHPGGILMVVCYSEDDENAKGGVAMAGTYGNVMYYRTADQIRELHKSLTEISYQPAHLGKRLHHSGHCFLFQRPS